MEPGRDVPTASAASPGIGNVEHVPTLGPIVATGDRVKA
jgi:hypothetical protein